MDALSPRLREFERTLILSASQRRDFHALVLDAIKLECAYDRAKYRLEQIEALSADTPMPRPVMGSVVQYRRLG